MQDSFDLTGLAVVALVAMVCGMLMTRLKQPAVVGYIVAGVVLGPSLLGLVSSRRNVDVLAELGVLLLLFTVGMEMSLRAFRQVWQVALLCTMLQIFGSLAVMLLISVLLGWPTEVGILFGFILALSSTAVAIKVLEEIDELRTRVGQIAVGVLIAQDMAVVPMLLVVNDLAGEAIGLMVPFKIALSIVVLVLIIRFLSRRERVSLPFGGVIASHTDLAPLMGLVYCFGGAGLAGVLGLSPVYGAFLAGLIIGNSAERAPMIAMTHPIRSVLMMVFFLSIGLLLDLRYVWDNLGTVLFLMVVVTLFKTAFNIGLLRLLRQPWTRAFIAGLTLSQLGEFSFLLTQTGSRTAIISADAYRLIITVTVLSLVISPYWLTLMRRLEAVAAPRIVSLGDLIQLLYGSETASVWERSGLRPLILLGRLSAHALRRAGVRIDAALSRTATKGSSGEQPADGAEASPPPPPGASKRGGGRDKG
ncbi:MAG: cation:proton antiporter [Kiloniellales bacterium]